MLNNTYNILELIGEGNFGRIYKGSNKLTNELVAIKVEPIQKQLKLLLCTLLLKGRNSSPSNDDIYKGQETVKLQLAYIPLRPTLYPLYKQ